MPLAYQSSTIVNSLLGTKTEIGIPSPSWRIRFRYVHFAPWQPVLNGQRPLNRIPPSTRTPLPTGAKTPLARGSPSPRISSCASSGKQLASQATALKIVETHDVDGQPRATAASTSICVRKSAS